MSVSEIRLNDVSIAQINEWKNNSEKVDVIIGRKPSEAIPESVKGLRCVSLDDLADDPIESTRVSLKINCNKAEQMKTIQGLFNRVFIDLNTTKYFDEGTLDYLVGLVEQGGSLFLPSENQFLQPNPDVEFFKTNHFTIEVGTKKSQAYQAVSTHFEEELLKRLSNNNIPDNSRENLIQNMHEYKAWEERETLKDPSLSEIPLVYRISEFLEGYKEASGILAPSYSEEEDAARECTKSYLLNFFDDVQICHQSYPLANRLDGDGSIPNYYFHATGRK
ncbi:MAG TPA: hypothetical protein VFA52_00050 [Candidatus Paceibacterota bacterium]|nr:hypothetical protein [Candidatus Paceibacterota bacterium]